MKYLYLKQIIFTLLYDIKYSYLIQTIVNRRIFFHSWDSNRYYHFTVGNGNKGIFHPPLNSKLEPHHLMQFTVIYPGHSFFGGRMSV